MRRALPAAAALLLLLSLAACSRPGPKELPDRTMSLDIQGLPASQIVEMAAAVGGFRLEWTAAALERAERSSVDLQVEDARWDDVLDRALHGARLARDWVEREGEWLLRIRLPEEE
jgi:hypothetical protein